MYGYAVYGRYVSGPLNVDVTDFRSLLANQFCRHSRYSWNVCRRLRRLTCHDVVDTGTGSVKCGVRRHKYASVYLCVLHS